MMTLALLVRIAVTVGTLSIALRMTGKRGWFAARPLDLVIAFVLGNISGNIVLGRMPVSEGIAAIGLLIWMHVLISIVINRSLWLRTWIYGAPTDIIHDGQLQRLNIARVRLSDDDIEMLLHREGITRVSEVKTLRIEPDGGTTLIRQPHVRLLTKASLAYYPSSQQEEEPWQQAA